MYPIRALFVGFAFSFSLVAGCASERPTPAPAPVVELASATLPAEWVTVASDAGGLWISLPPWIKAFETSGAVFASEMRANGGLQLLAEGPRTAEPQPGPAGLEQWLLDRLASPGVGLARLDQTTLPAGVAVHLQRIDRPETALAWRFEAWAIATQGGTAFLVVDGPPRAWVDREDDVRLIAELLRFDREPEQAPASR